MKIGGSGLAEILIRHNSKWVFVIMGGYDVHFHLWLREQLGMLYIIHSLSSWQVILQNSAKMHVKQVTPTASCSSKEPGAAYKGSCRSRGARGHWRELQGDQEAGWFSENPPPDLPIRCVRGEGSTSMPFPPHGLFVTPTSMLFSMGTF